MTTTPPAAIGDPVDEIDTPTLIVDLDAFEANVALMAKIASEAGIAVRPHAKTHRCSAVALRQVAAGAVGQCAQTVGETEALVAGGIRDVIVTNQILSPRKLARLAHLAGQATIGLLVDSEAGVAAAAAAAREAGTELGILVEIEVGMNRCGAAPGKPAAAIARMAADQPGLKFRGIQAYNGRAQHIVSWSGRRDAVDRAAVAVDATLEALGRIGLEAEIVGGAGTGTFRFEAACGLWTELQAGSYVFMDAEYAGLENEAGYPDPEFRQSLFVLADVISTPAPGRAIVNAGLKVLTTEQGPPQVDGRPDADINGVSDEHARLQVGNGLCPGLGERLRLIPGHCDPTVNLHDWIVAVRNGSVEEIWAVDGRGASR